MRSRSAITSPLRRTEREMGKVRYIAKPVSDKEPLETDLDEPWPGSDELSSVDDGSDSPPPGVGFFGKAGDRARRLDKEPLYVRDTTSTISDVTNKLIAGADCSPSSNRSCSTRRPSGGVVVRSTLLNAQVLAKTGIQSSVDNVSMMSRTTTLRRCWGALKEALDELGNTWDGYEDEGGNNEASSAGSSRGRCVSENVSHVKENSDEHVTSAKDTCSSDEHVSSAKDSSDEPVAPQTPLRPPTGKSRPSHYDTLTSSPVGSRSSKRGRKLQPWLKTPTPVRRTRGFAIDHYYSTEDEDNDPNIRMRNRFFRETSFNRFEDNFYALMYKQDSRSEATDPVSENHKPELNHDTERALSTNSDNPHARRRVPVANPLGPLIDGAASRSVADLVSGVCQHGAPLFEHKCELLHQVESISARTRVAETASSCESQHYLAARTTDECRVKQPCSSGSLVERENDPITSNTEQSSENALDARHVPTPDNLRDDVKAIFQDREYGRNAVNDASIRSKLNLAERLKEAFRPRHAEVGLDNRPGARRDQPAAENAAYPTHHGSSFHLSDSGVLRQVGDYPPTRSSISISNPHQLTETSKEKLPQEEVAIDQWLQNSALQGEIPHEGILDGTCLPNPPSPKFRKLERLKRRLREPTSCVILPVGIPPERDTKDLLTMPFMVFDPVSAAKGPGPWRPQPGETLMSAFGVSCDSVPAHHVVCGGFSSTDGIMCHSAAMGSMSLLGQIDANTESTKAEIVRAKKENAKAANSTWHNFNDASKFLDCSLDQVPTSHDVCGCLSSTDDILSRSAAMGSVSWLSQIDVVTQRRKANTTRTKEEENISWHNISEASRFLDCRIPSAKEKWPWGKIIIFLYNVSNTHSQTIGYPRPMQAAVRLMNQEKLHLVMVAQQKDVWDMWNLRSLPDFRKLPPPDVIDCFAESYLLSTLRLFDKGSVESFANLFAESIAFDRPPGALQRHKDLLLQHGLSTFLQLALIRSQALKDEMWRNDHPEVPLQSVPWQTVGYDWKSPVVDGGVQRCGVRRKSRVPSDPMVRVRENGDWPEALRIQREKQRLLPQARHLPSSDAAFRGAAAPTAIWSDPTPDISPLRAMVLAQEDEKLTKMHTDFEEFRRTGTPPEVKKAVDPVEDSDPMAMWLMKPYCSRDFYKYRPYSYSPSTQGRAQVAIGPVNSMPSRTQSPTTRRLGSTELFPDRFRFDAAKDNSATSNVPMEARDSVSCSINIKTPDLAHSQVATSNSYGQGDTLSVAAQPEPAQISASSSRRSVARSDDSNISAAPSTVFGRARKAPAIQLSRDKSRVELHNEKSAASVAFITATADIMEDIVRSIKPSGNKQSAEDVTKKLSRSPTRRGSVDGLRDRAVFHSVGNDDDRGVTGREGQSSKRPRRNTIMPPISRKQQKRDMTDNDTDAMEALMRPGILPPPLDEGAAASPPREGATEGDQTSRSNAEPQLVYPTESATSLAMPRRRDNPGPPPKTPLPLPPSLSQDAELMWRDQDMTDARESRPRRISVFGPQFDQPPTPRMHTVQPVFHDDPFRRRNAPAMPESDSHDEPKLQDLMRDIIDQHDIIDQEDRNFRANQSQGPEQSDRGREREGRSQTPSSEATSSKSIFSRFSKFGAGSAYRELEVLLGSRRRSRSQDGERVERSLRVRSRERKEGEDDGFLLKPLTPIPQSLPRPTVEDDEDDDGDSESDDDDEGEDKQVKRVMPSRPSQGFDQVKLLTPLPSSSEHELMMKPRSMRKRPANISEIASGQVNQRYREESEWMTDNPRIRRWSTEAQDKLYGAMDINSMTHTPILHLFPSPTRDPEVIQRTLDDMVWNKENYGIGGPPGPVDVDNIDYFTDISGVYGREQTEHAREAKAFAGFALFTRRQEEINHLHRMRKQGYLPDDVEIMYGFQERAPHGAIAWVTYNGQAIGGALRDQYETRIQEEKEHKQAQFDAEFYEGEQDCLDEKDCQDEQDYNYQRYEQQQQDLQQRHDSKVDTHPPNETPLVYSADCTPRCASQLEDLNVLITGIALKRRGSDDSVKTAYNADEQVPDSAYCDRNRRSPDFYI